MEQRVTSDRRPAPSLMVIYSCPKCIGEITLDAYDGPPSCSSGHKKIFMNAIALDKRGINPIADIEKLRQTKRGKFS